MRILVIGHAGLIGSAVAHRLLAEGHELRGVGRRGGQGSPFPVFRFDITAAAAEDWRQPLDGVDAVVNCAGALQDAPCETLRDVHARALGPLLDACEAAGIRRIVHFSALGVDRETPSDFSRTKREGERLLMSRDLDWVILRPSVVVGRPAYGASALMRGLAALPILPVMPATGALQIVRLEDVVDTVAAMVRPDAPGRLALDLVGPRRWQFTEVVQALRAWMGWRPAREMRLPAPVAALSYRLGDLAGYFGWRPPVRSTAQREVVRGAVGDPAEWRRATGIAPQALEDALRLEPASVQERWFARLYLLKALVFGVFGLFWIATGLISLGPGWEAGMKPLREGGVGEGLATAAIVAGGLADIVIGLAILYRPTSRAGLWAGLAISVIYAVIGTLVLPRLWIDPLGPMLKIFPIMVLNLVALAILEDR